MGAPTTRKRKDAHLWARDPDDFYLEPRWCDEALFRMEPFEGMIVDPACGTGRILDAARAAGHHTTGFDIRDRSPQHQFGIASVFDMGAMFENIVSNPPYLYADRFLEWCVQHSIRKTALLLRAQWANAGTRSRWLESLPLRRVLAITPRPSMPPGAVVLAQGDKGDRGINGGQQDYSWFIFERGFVGRPEFGWARRESAAQKTLPAARPTVNGALPIGGIG